ncbi:MAG: glycosyltransferase family 2 protein [Anaerolineaceae bacterium]|mgnify:CR=1 FL=1|jgi:glycosyltransferase involved in cell wall biosynthesis
MITVILPIRNEANYINRCLDAVLAQDIQQEQLEMLVVDGMSEDRTPDIVMEYQKANPNIQLIQNPGKIVPTGMNEAIRITTGEIIIRVDGHCVISPDYVSNCIRHLQEDAVDAVGGPMQTIGEDFISEVIALVMSSKFGVGDSSFRTETGQTKLVDTVPFPAYTREIIERVGLYDEELVRNQDDEYNYRIREAGGKILLAQDVRSTYFSRGSFAKLWKQYYQYGFWKVRVLQKHPMQMSLRQFVPPVFVLSIIISLLLTLVNPWGWIFLALILGAYLAVNLGFSIYISARHGWKFLLSLPVAFAIIHVSYGSGFLVGLFRFANRWNDKTGKVPPL